MKGCYLILIAFKLINASIAKEKRQGFGGGYGCGATLPTIGNYCYQPVQDGTVVCRGKSCIMILRLLNILLPIDIFGIISNNFFL